MNIAVHYIMPQTVYPINGKLSQQRKSLLTHPFIRLKEIKKKKKPTYDPFIIDTEKEFNTVEPKFMRTSLVKQTLKGKGKLNQV